MNDEKFELTICDLARSGTYYADIADELRARDTAQRDTIKAWKAAQAREAAALAQAWEQRDAAQAQLSEADALLTNVMNCTSFREIGEVEMAIAAYFARNVQAEQQEAGHGHITPRADGVVMKCGGPGLCAVCTAEQEAKGAQVGEFQREDRYIVIKRKDLDAAPMKYREWFKGMLSQLEPHLPKRQYLVIESDWPEYEPTWAAIQARVTRQGAQAVDERAAFEHWASDEGRWPKAVERDGKFYKLAQTQSYWHAWQARAALATQHAEWADQLYTQGFDAGAAASKRLNAVRGAEHDQ